MSYDEFLLLFYLWLRAKEALYDTSGNRKSVQPIHRALERLFRAMESAAQTVHEDRDLPPHPGITESKKAIARAWSEANIAVDLVESGFHHIGRRHRRTYLRLAQPRLHAVRTGIVHYLTILVLSGKLP